MAIVAKINVETGEIDYVEEELQDFTQPEPIPTLTPRQVRFVLNAAGLRETVEAMIAQADQYTKDWWEWSNEFKYDHPILQQMAGQLGLTHEQVEQMFRDGSLL